jgi:hypothetical protein
VKKLVILIVLAGGLSVQAETNQCMIVRSAEGHRFRNSMIAGALTGGIGFAAGAAFGGGKYEYVDSFNVPNYKLKYKGGELEKLKEAGVHIIVVNKKATADETKSARDSCTAHITPTLVNTSAPVQPVMSKPAAQTTESAQAPHATESTVVSGDESLGDAARKAKEQKQSAQSPPQ